MDKDIKKSNDGYSVKSVMGVGSLAEILKKHISQMNEPGVVAALPDSVNFSNVAEYFNLPPEQQEALMQDIAAFTQRLGEIMKKEEAEFGVEVDHNDPLHIWSNTDEEIQEACVRAIEQRYQSRTGEIVFYGPSNIQMWYSLETDMLPYKAQNHGMGGCVDVEMIKYAPRMLYAFAPSVVFFQTGSNDLANGFSLEQIIENKKQMYSLFRSNMPDTKLVVMSGLPLPGRQEFWPATVQVNALLRKLCEETDGMYFMDATDVMLSSEGAEDMKTSTGDGRYFESSYFRMDGIHLNKKGHDVWTVEMKKMLRTIGSCDGSIEALDTQKEL